MEIITPEFKILDELDGKKILKLLETCGRICYQSEGKMTEDSAEEFIAKIIRLGHESVLEHAKITVVFLTDRGITHQLVRHRIASYSQESTRYVRYKGSMRFTKPSNLKRKEALDIIENLYRQAEESYAKLIELGEAPQDARTVLPTGVKTQIACTMNLRQWRLVLKERTSAAAHPDMRKLMLSLLKEFKAQIPVVFDDIKG